MIPQAVIFDFDGTLADTIPAITRGINLTMQKYGFPLHTEAEVITYINNGPRMLIRRSLPKELQADEELLDRVLADYNVFYKTYCLNSDPPYEGIPEAVAVLRRQGYRIGVLSNKQDHLLGPLCESVIPGGYDATVGSLPDKPTKPDPYLSQKIAGLLGVDPQACIMIGDSDVDITTASNAGMTHIGVSWGYRDEAFLRKNGADIVVRTPRELYSLIETKVKEQKQ